MFIGLTSTKHSIGTFYAELILNDSYKITFIFDYYDLLQQYLRICGINCKWQEMIITHKAGCPLYHCRNLHFSLQRNIFCSKQILGMLCLKSTPEDFNLISPLKLTKPSVWGARRLRPSSVHAHLDTKTTFARWIPKYFKRTKVWAEVNDKIFWRWRTISQSTEWNRSTP